MKIIISLTILLTVFAACKKSDAGTANRDPAGGNILGKWKEIEYIADIGGGNGTWQPANPANIHYINFKENSIVFFSSNSPYPFEHYELTSDSTIRFSTNSQIFDRWYEISNSTLTISGGCFEACATKYIRTSDY